MIRVHRITTDHVGRAFCTNDSACKCNPVSLVEVGNVSLDNGEIVKRARMLIIHEPWRFMWDERVAKILEERKKKDGVE